MGVSDFLIKVASKIENSADNLSKNLAIVEIKKKTLRRFYPEKLISLAREHQLDIPTSKTDRFERMVNICSSLSGNEIFDFAERHRIPGIYELKDEYLSIVDERDEVNDKLWGRNKSGEKVKKDLSSLHSDLFNKVVQEIKDFKPKVVAGHEQPYQFLLFGWLQREFPDLKIEEQRGSSRPDIVIKDIAIEVKGPTEHCDLQTVADKLIRYHQHFKGGIIVVLFNVKANARLYSEWERGIKLQHPKVVIFRK
ncbi:MAG: hypothetical protein WCW13_04620 [archaeon]|jgi:hypothetical protein